jgi:hypothetical protein
VASVVGAAEHWDGAYAHGDTTRSWFQHQPAVSLRMIDITAVWPDDSVIDVGGGASVLIDALLARGFGDVTVLDVSKAGLDIARRRLGSAADRVHWLRTDILTWQPQRTYRVWHDRAVLHFLTTGRAQRQYLHALHAATVTTAVAIFGCFAPDGPQQCSGLPVARYGPAELAAVLDKRWTLRAEDRERHTTPTGAIQPFTWAAFRRQPGDSSPAPPGSSGV